MRRHLAVAALLAAAGGAVEAAPVQWTGAGSNGHWYEFISGGQNFTGARDGAAAMTHMGMTGYLVTITSAAEQAFLDSLTSSVYWLGASDADVEGDWRWVTGPEAGTLFWRQGVGPITYANWSAGEPNNSGGEDYAHANFNPDWNDIGAGGSYGYVVEYGDVSAIPLPAALPLLLGGFGALGLVARRRGRG